MVAEKKGPSLVYQFQRSMESGDASDEEASPCDPISNNQMQKEWSKAISMLVDMETEDGLKRRAVMVIAEKIGLAHADLLYYKCKNILLLLCTPVVLIYNSELGIIISSDSSSTKLKMCGTFIHQQKNTQQQQHKRNKRTT